MKSAIVICSRVDSSRVREKAFALINGIPVIEHLVGRAAMSGIPVIVAVPRCDVDRYAYLHTLHDDVDVVAGSGEDPLERMAMVARAYDLEAVVRVCHDKIFCVPTLITHALADFDAHQLDYLYSSRFTAGSGFEIISRSALEAAAAKHKMVEHVSYAVKSLGVQSLDWSVPEAYRSDFRFLIDYPEDVTLLDVVLSQIGNNGNLLDAIELLKSRPFLAAYNRMPDVSVYTCGYNAERWVDSAMRTTAGQSGVKFEYILVDDCSTDRTPLLMAEFAANDRRVSFYRNPRNLGLAASSNVALSKARGKYIVRLDADDMWTSSNSVRHLLDCIEKTGKDAIYPANQHGAEDTIQLGDEQHHVGGSIFKRSAVNHFKFTEALRGYEGLDFFVRARQQLDIGYTSRPVFFYRQHRDSMSKTNLEERAKIRAEIEARL